MGRIVILLRAEMLVAYDPPLPVNLKNVGWRVKIRDKEIREPPHVTIIRKTNAWRIDLRTQEFMDKQPDPNDISADVTKIIKENCILLCQQWDAMYPNNPVADNEA